MQYPRIIPLPLALAVLLGCATPEQRAADVARLIESEFGPACEALGHRPPTDAYQNCTTLLFRHQPAGDKAARMKAQM